MASHDNQNHLAGEVPAPPHPHVCFIIPLPMLQHIINNSDNSEAARAAAQKTYNHCCILRQKRMARHAELNALDAHPSASAGLAKVPAVIHRKIYDSKKGEKLRGTLVLEDGNPQLESMDVSVREVWEYFGKTYQFYQEVFGRNSVDNQNMDLLASVHYDDEPGPPGMDNAFWAGNTDETAFGDGDGEIFASFTKVLDVIGHELTHAVVQFTANLDGSYQSGALNESIADCFGSMIKQFFHPSGKQTAAAADWLIGEGIFVPGLPDAAALRSMKAPGTAHSNPKIGIDDQAADMDGYVHTPNNARGDWGGVHANCGIPNRAFFLTAVALGGHSWDQAGKIWYAALQDDELKRIDNRKAFKIFALLTVKHALKLFGSDAAGAVKKAWTRVKVLTTADKIQDDL